ncbi:MAG: hypothetical protein V1664_03845, partial [Candidatus Uhrbacteria bacterium]
MPSLLSTIFQKLINSRIFFLVVFFVGVFFFCSVQAASADTHTWDGGGGDNNWSTCANWDQTDTCPISTDSVVFDGTSTKASTIDAGFGGTIAAFSINAGYTGETAVITQSRSLIINGAFVQSAGTFSGGSDSLDFNNTFTLNSGATFISTSGTATFASTWTIAEGAGSNAFQHNGGTVTFDTGGAVTVNVDGTNVDVDEIFNNVTINKSGLSTLNGTANEILVVNGTLTLTDGYWGGASGAYFDPKGAVAVGTGFDGGAGIVMIDEAGSQAITLTGGGKAPALTINNASATVSTTGTGTVTLSGAFTLQNGIVNQGDLATTFSSTFTQSGGTFNAGSSTNTFSGAFTLTSGTFNSAGTPSFNGVVAINGGAFNAGGNTNTFGQSGSFTISGGTFNGGAVPLTFNSNLTINVGGTFISTSGSAAIGGNFTIAEGAGADAFQHNNGAITPIQGPNMTNPITFNVDSTNSEADEVFYDFNIARTAGYTLSGTANETLVVSHTLTLTDGVWAGASGAKISVTGNIVVASANSDGGAGIIEIATGTHTLTANAAGKIPALLINDASAHLDLAGASTATFNNGITLQDGTFDQNSTVMTVAGTFAQSGGTFTGGSVAMTFSGAATLSGGAFSGSSTTTTFSSTFAQSGGTFNGAGTNTFSSTTALSGTAIFNAGSGTKTFTGAFTQSGGTFNGDTATLDFNSSFTINNAGATFTSTSGTLSIAGNWTHSAGTFNHNNGTVVYDGSGQGTQTFDVNINEDFYNFKIDCSGSGTECAAVWFVLASGDSLTANHDFYFTDGHVAVSGGGHFHAKGDIFTSDGYSVSNGTSFNLYVDGTSLQTITTSGTGYFYGQNLIINNSAGVNLVGNILMTGSSVQAITLQAGI